MKRKMLYVFISLIFVCLLSTSIVCAADNTTETTDDNADVSESMDVEDTTTQNTNIETGTLYDFRNDLVENDCNISLKRNYELTVGPDSGYVSDGIVLNNSDIFIEGNNYTINLNSLSRLFSAYNSTVVINNLNIRNTKGCAIRAIGSDITTNHVNFINNDVENSRAVVSFGSSYKSNFDTFTNLKDDWGSAVSALSGSSLVLNNATFNLNHKQVWGSVYISDSEAIVANTTFANMKSKYSTAIYDSNSTLLVSNCTFINLNAEETAGAIAVKDTDEVVVIDNCKFINVTSIKNAGALYADINGMSGVKDGKVLVNSTTFDGCGSLFGGAILHLGGGLMIINSTLTDNFAIINGGAVYASSAILTVINSTFEDNSVEEEFEDYNKGGAIYFDNGELTIDSSTFKGNTALEGTDLYLYDSEYDISNSYFAGNISSMFDEEDSVLKNNTFLGKNSFNETDYVYVYQSSGSQINYSPIYLDESLANATSFDLRDYGLVTPVKDQGDMGACWAFGVTGALESAYLKASNKTALLDISESNIQDSGLTYYMFGMEDTYEGSYRTVGTSYMLSWLGVTTSDDNTYDELGKISPIYDNGTKYHIHRIVLLEPRQNLTDNQKFKDALVKYGALGVSVHGASKEDSTFNEDTNAAYYYNETFGLGTDHSVTLVGWNDSFSRSNFVTTPPGDGAWIIKNSWGSEWADEGYYYVSYYDTAFGTSKLPVAFIIDNDHDYEKNYQYDIISNVEFNEYTQDTSYANKFKSIGRDLIAAVGTYFNDTGVNYKIEIFVNDILVHTQTGVSKYPGYDTISLNKYVAVNENDTFVAQISTGRNIPISNNTRQHYQEGVSFIGPEGTVNEDISKSGAVVCVKVYTIADNSSMVIEYSQNIVQVQYFDEEANPLSNANVIIRVNGYEYLATTDEDGVATFMLNLPGGKNTVTVINPVNGEEENITITIPSDNEKPVKTYNYNVKKVSNVKEVKNSKTLHKSYKVSVNDKVVYEGRYFTIQTLNDIFGQNFTKGHLVVYLDGKVVFNATVGDDISTIIFEIIESLLGNHELKVEFTVGNNTQSYEQNITIY